MLKIVLSIIMFHFPSIPQEHKKSRNRKCYRLRHLPVKVDLSLCSVVCLPVFIVECRLDENLTVFFYFQSIKKFLREISSKQYFFLSA